MPLDDFEGWANYPSAWISSKYWGPPVPMTRFASGSTHCQGRRNNAVVHWARERAKATVPLLHRPNMNADAIHAALGLAFTAVWLLVGQILVGNR